MYTSPAEKVLPTGYICNGMCAHVVVYEIIIAHKAVRLYNVCIFVSPLALDQRCRHALYQCIKCLLAGAFIQVQNLKVIITKINFRQTTQVNSTLLLFVL